MYSHTYVSRIAASRELTANPLTRLFDATDEDNTVLSLAIPLLHRADDKAPFVSCAVLPYAPCLQLAFVLRLTSDALA